MEHEFHTEPFYPKSRTRPLILANISSTLDFLNFIQLLEINSEQCLFRIFGNEKIDHWDDEGGVMAINYEDNFISITTPNLSKTYTFKDVDTSKDIPESISRSRFKNKIRAVMTITRKKKALIMYQKELHRLCFNLKIWSKLAVN